MSVVVTGGAGFIGANLCRRLVADGHSVTVLDDLSSGSHANLEGVDVELVEGSILDRAALDHARRDATAIVHLAARTSVPRSVDEPVATHVVNATGTVEVLEAARLSGCHTIVASSASVYGANPALPRREDLATLPMSPSSPVTTGRFRAFTAMPTTSSTKSIETTASAPISAGGTPRPLPCTAKAWSRSRETLWR